MSYFDDYIADGMCCECCGAYLGDEPGFMRRCDGCKEPSASPRSTRSKVATAIAKDKIAASRGEQS